MNIGTKKGDTRLGPFSMNARMLSSNVAMPPVPGPMMSPLPFGSGGAFFGKARGRGPPPRPPRPPRAGGGPGARDFVPARRHDPHPRDPHPPSHYLPFPILSWR